VDALLHYSEQFRGPYWTILLRLAIIIAAYAFVGPVLARRFHDSKPDPARIRAWAIFVAILAWIILFSVGMLRHLSFHSKAWDLAIFDQVIWNLANGNGWECSVRGVMDLRGDHFEPILLLFVPLYKILPHVGWLLGFQAAALVGTGLVLRTIYRERIGETAAFLLFLAFCFYPPVHWLALADFHPIAIAPFFIAIGWLGSRRNNILLFLVGLIGMILCGEEAFIVAGWWCLWEFLSRKPWARSERGTPGSHRIIAWGGLALMAIFWAGFVYLSFVWIPAHRMEGEGYFYIHRYSYLGSSMAEIIRSFFLKPGLWIKHAFDSRGIALLFLYLVPLAFLPLKRPGTLLILIPTLLYTLLSVSDEQRSIFHQYTAMWIPLLFIITAESMIIYRTTASWTMDMRINPKKIQARRASALIIASFLGFLFLSPILGFSMHPGLMAPESWAPEAAGVVQSVDTSEAVSAPSALCPHLSHRRILLLQPETSWPGTDGIKTLPEFPLE